MSRLPVAIQGLKQGLKQGVEKGLKRGIELGIQSGREEGEREAMLKIVRTMRQNGMDDAAVMKMTGLSKEELAQLSQ